LILVGRKMFGKRRLVFERMCRSSNLFSGNYYKTSVKKLIF